MAGALSEYVITGIKTTIPFQAKIMQNADFLRGDFDTGFVEKIIRMKQLDVNVNIPGLGIELKREVVSNKS
jgi:acetyl/propionyl-CoA carboxylase alpha subunit